MTPTLRDEETPFGAAFRLPACTDETTLVVAGNIIAQYGKDGLRRLLRGFSRGVPFPALAPQFGVSTQRVQQWNEALGTKVEAYRVHPDILEIAEESFEDEAETRSPADSAENPGSAPPLS